MSDTEDKSQKTEEPSQRRLEKARQQGDVFTSKEVNSFLSIFTFSLGIIMFGSFFCKSLMDNILGFINSPVLSGINKNAGSTPDGDVMQVAGAFIFNVLPFILIPPLIMMIVNVSSILLQHGIIYSPEVIQPKLERISPIAGFKRIFSLNSVMELLKGIVKILLIGSVAYIAIKSQVRALTYSYGMSIDGGLLLLEKALQKLLVGVCCFMFFLAIVDYLYQRFAYVKKMRMSKKEVKDEHKEQEGSPEVKSKLRSLRVKLSKRRIMAAVPNADVVITNPTHYAVALEFKAEKMDTPVVVAKGQDDIAMLIRNIARQNNIPIVANPPLARLLFAELDVGMKIKEKHYKLVAEIIMYVMRLQKKKIKAFK